MKVKQLLFMLTLLALPVLSVAQSGDILSQTRTWNSSTGIDLITSDTLESVMKFKSFSSDRIEHTGPRGTVQTFDIITTDGTWADISQAGTITYQVSINGVNGVIAIERSSLGVFLTVDMSSAGGIKVRYNIQSIE